MANKDFNFEEFLTEPKNRLARQGKQHTTRNTRTTSNTNRSTLHPFSVRLDKPYIDKIKAIAWYRKISQREVIEQAIDVLMNDMNPKEMEKTISEFVHEHFGGDDSRNHIPIQMAISLLSRVMHEFDFVIITFV